MFKCGLPQDKEIDDQDINTDELSSTLYRIRIDYAPITKSPLKIICTDKSRNKKIER
jgi:hypothetical protein